VTAALTLPVGREQEQVDATVEKATTKTRQAMEAGYGGGFDLRSGASRTSTVTFWELVYMKQ